MRTWFSRIHYSRNKRKQDRFHLGGQFQRAHRGREFALQDLNYPIAPSALWTSFDLSTLNPGAPRKRLPYHRAILDEIGARNRDRWARNRDGARRAMHRLMDLTERNITSALLRRNGGSGCQP